MTRDARLASDYEGRRLIAVYEASRAKEHVAAGQLLYPRHSLPLSAYIKLVDDLRSARKDCNDTMLAVRVHQNKMAVNSEAPTGISLLQFYRPPNRD
jgi:hypothetical protein